MNFPKVIKNGVEFRKDPLTLEESRLNPARAKRVKPAVTEEGLTQLVNNSKHDCPFCPEVILDKTPLLPERVSRGGRIREGSALLFPNKNPFSENHVVIVLGELHYQTLDELSEKTIENALIASQKYIEAVYKDNRKARIPIILWNYMPPSAGSIIHPHIQLLIEEKPPLGLKKYLNKSKKFYEKQRKSYWEDLVITEKQLDERFIGETNHFSIIASFAPRGFNEIQFIFKNISSLCHVNKQGIQEFSRYLRKALRCYNTMGVGSFNLISYSSPTGEYLPYFPLSFKLISRPFPSEIYTNDTGPLERLYDTWVVDTLPEEVAQTMKHYFHHS
ncbi:MAG: hypothetical protein SVW57_00550 [Thermodesulfobacteriota bacterium]|nr:hypothetical protein [Thermodesulfobacteriota bacterium]